MNSLIKPRESMAVRVGVIALALIGVLTMSAHAQIEREVIGTVRIEDETDAPSVSVEYGFGSDYTDTTDYEEVEIFALPPGVSFYGWLNRPCDGEFAGDPCRWQEDYRGVPDSVESGEVEQFSLEYEIGLYNNSSGPLTLRILNPDFPEEVDSIHFVDPLLPSAFDHTITRAAVLEITDEFTSRLTMTVYYNLATSSVGELEVTGRQADVSIAPTVVRGRELTVSGRLSLADRIEILTVDGRLVGTHHLNRPAAEQEVDVSSLPNGVYMIVLRGGAGAPRAIAKIAVAR